MDQSKITPIVERYIERILQRFSPVQIILYGSYAKGCATHNSDIDIAVVVSEIKGDYLDEIQLLYKLRRGLDDRIEPVLLKSSNDPSGFLRDVRHTGIVVFSAA